MDFLSSKRFVTTALVLLALLNITLMGVLWWQNFVNKSYRTVQVTRFYSSSDPRRGNELNLTDQQKEAFRKLRQEHFRKTMPSVQKIIAFKAKLSAIADSIGKRQAWIEKDLALHFHDLSMLCTPAQRDSLEKLLNNIYTVRYQRMNSWRDRSHRDYRDGVRNGPFPPPPPPEN
jgi:DNA-binding MarR family transcriptional regulator